MANLLGHRPQAPVRSPFGSRLKRLADRGRNLVVTDLARRTGARLVVEPVHAALREAVAPSADGVSAHADLLRDLLVLKSTRRGQHNARSLRNRLGRAVLARERRQLALLRLIEYDRYRSAPLCPAPFSPPASQSRANVTDLPIRTLARLSH
jgi:hypothetical protein